MQSVHRKEIQISIENKKDKCISMWQYALLADQIKW